VAEEEQRRATLLAEVSRVLASALDYEHTLRSMVGLVVPSLADRCIVEVDAAQGTNRWVATAHASHTSGDNLPEPDAEITLLLLCRGVTLGKISFLLMSSERDYSEADRALAEEIAHRTALAIDQARLYRGAVAANQAKSDFLAVMSHELRTPLNAVLGYVELLRMGVPEPIPQRSQQHVERIRLSTRHLLQLIEEILTFSRMEAGKEEIREEQIEIAPFVRETAALMEPLAEEKQLAFRVDASGAPRRCVRMSPSCARSCSICSPMP
jgi:signal transduction histidine kinase